MTTSPPVVSVIIPAYNEESHIADCLRSVLNQDFSLPYEVLVVDGPSTDGTRVVAGQFPVQTIGLAQRGIGLAWKAGATYSLSDLLVFTEADSIVPPHWLGTIHKTLEENPHAVGVAGGYAFRKWSRFANFLTKCSVYLFDQIHNAWKGTIPFRGRNFAIRKPALSACGGFDEEVELYGDIELSLRAARYGKIIYRPSLRVETVNRNFTGWANTFRFIRRFVSAMYWIEVAGQPRQLKFSRYQTNAPVKRRKTRYLASS